MRGTEPGAGSRPGLWTNSRPTSLWTVPGLVSPWVSPRPRRRSRRSARSLAICSSCGERRCPRRSRRSRTAATGTAARAARTFAASSMRRLRSSLRLELRRAWSSPGPSTTNLPGGHEPQRLEAARARVVVLQEEAVDVELGRTAPRRRSRSRPRPPTRSGSCPRHMCVVTVSAVRPAGERGVDLPDVALVLVLGVAALRGELGALLRVVEVGQAGVVELQVACSRARRAAAPARA